MVEVSYTLITFVNNHITNDSWAQNCFCFDCIIQICVSLAGDLCWMSFNVFIFIIMFVAVANFKWWCSDRFIHLCEFHSGVFAGIYDLYSVYSCICLFINRSHDLPFIWWSVDCFIDLRNSFRIRLFVMKRSRDLMWFDVFELKFLLI